MWQYLWVTGTDFDGNQSDRLVSGGFVALDVIQAGKVFKLAKVKVLSKGGRVVNITNRTVLKTIAKETLKDASIDISCQFVANLIKYLDEIKSRLDFENAMIKAFEDIDVKGAVLDASFNITDKDNAITSTSLVCVREILSKMQNNGVEWKSIGKGSINCLVEIGGAFFEQWVLKKGKGVPFLNEQQQKKSKSCFQYV